MVSVEESVHLLTIGMLISVIIPCFNEEKVLESTYQRLSTVLREGEGRNYEFIFIDDGSVDSTPAILRAMAEKDPRVTVVRFSRNFGHQPAVSAGIRQCRGDLAVIIDADLQDPPEVVPDMLRQLVNQKANVVYGVRKRRKGETWFKLVTAKLFYFLLNKLSEVPMPLNTGDFRVIDRKVINAFNALPENTKYIRGLISWMGFKQTPYYYERDARFAGSTKYSLTRMIRFASTGIFYFSKKPLQIATAFGFLSVGVGLLLSAWLLFNKFLNPQYLVSGWTSIVLLVIYFGGVQLLTIGILGQYIGNLFDEVKRRPEYIVDEVVRQKRERVGKDSVTYFPLAEEPLAPLEHDQTPPETFAREKKSYVTSDSGG
jgi:dolichol-phosphate mannosyltransferase